MIARSRSQALVVNDDASFETRIVEMMAAVNWDCEVVTSPEKALSRLKSGQFDVVLTDYRLSHPQANGLHFISCLRRDGITLPAIVISEDGDVLQTVPKDLLTIPAVLSKPFTISDLRAALNAACVV